MANNAWTWITPLIAGLLVGFSMALFTLKKGSFSNWLLNKFCEWLHPQLETNCLLTQKPIWVTRQKSSLQSRRAQLQAYTLLKAHGYETLFLHRPELDMGIVPSHILTADSLTEPRQILRRAREFAEADFI